MSESSYDSSDEELQKAFAKGVLKPGLNVVIERDNRQPKNRIDLMRQKLNEIKLDLPWIERLDMVNTLAPLAPELALQMQEQEVRRAKQLKGNRKLPQYEPSNDPVLNDFHRETMFHRQAQSAVLDAIVRLKKLNISTSRPDDYFAEMVKSDDHMQKVRENLMKKQAITQRTEKVRQLRQHKTVAKQMQVEATLKKHAEKKKFMEEVKKYRKGIRQDLDFLDDKKKPLQRKKQPKLQAKSRLKNVKYGYGGKKRNSKRNTKSSSADVSEYKRPQKPGTKRGRKGKSGKGNQRLGKSRRMQMKTKKK